MYVTVEKDRAKEFADIVFGCEMKPDAETEFAVSYEAYEVNWGAYNGRAEAAEKGILFYGTHAAGSEYGPCAFYGMDGESNEASTGHDGGYVVTADGDGNITESSQASLKQFVRNFKKAQARVNNPLYALTAYNTQENAC
jgi:hypothetical protein